MSNQITDKSKPASSSRLATLASRSISTAVLWCVVAAGVISGYAWIWFGITALLVLLGVAEYLKMLGPSMPRAHRWAAIGGSAIYLGFFYYHLQQGGSTIPGLLDTMAVVILVLGSFALQYHRPIAERKTLENVTNVVFSVLYVVFLFNFMVRIVFLPGVGDGGHTSGHLYALLLLAVTKFTDMGAFLVGSWLGKHKMSPHISPKKTWEGFVGAMIFSLIAAVAVYAPLQSKMPLLNWTHVLILAPILGIASVLGDLAESVVKRSLAVKDSGSTIPGIGGVLDLIDSICFTAPVLFFYLYLLR